MLSRRAVVVHVLTAPSQSGNHGEGLPSITGAAANSPAAIFSATTARAYMLIVAMSAGKKWFGGDPKTTARNSAFSSSFRSLGGRTDSRVEPLTAAKP